MEEQRTTEEMVASLSPEARAEAVRLAARLQAEGGEAAHVVAAAREAGVEDRFLREAVLRMGERPSPRAGSPVLPALAIVFFFFAQGYAGSFTYGSLHDQNIWIPLLFGALLGVALPTRRSRWVAPLIIAATWLLLTAYYVSIARLTDASLPEMGTTYAFRIAVLEMALAVFGAMLANALADSGRKRSGSAA